MYRSWAPNRRTLAAAAIALVGAALLGWAILQPQKEAAVPGWTPVNGQVAAELGQLEGDEASSSTKASEADSKEASTEASSLSGAKRQEGDVAENSAAGGSSSIRDGGAVSEGQTGEAVASTATIESAPGTVASPAAREETPSTAASSPEAGSSASVADGRLNLNTATAEQLDALKGIGPSKAQAIVAYRTEHGAFKSVEELLDVKGIGAKLYAGIRDQVKV